MKFYLYPLILCALWCGKLSAQPFPTRNIGLKDGLPEYFVSGLIQDKAGFIWVATRDGLARYDGRQFKVFRHLHSRKSSLANNVILSIQFVSDSTMLIQLENKHFQLFNPITEQFGDLLTDKQLQDNHINLANGWLTPDANQFWGRYRTQLIRFDRKKAQFETYPFPPLSLGSHYPGNSFIITKHLRLYAPFPGRLLEFDLQKEIYLSYKYPLVGLPGSTQTYYGTPLLDRANGDILIGAARQLISFNPKSKHFQTIPIPSAVDTQVGLIYESADGQVYFTYGLTVYQLSKNNQITPVWTASRIDYQNYFHALLVDRSGVLWIGTNGDGIQQIDMQALPIKTYPYQTNFVHDVMSVERQLAVPKWAKTDNQLIYQLRLEGNAPFLSVGLDNWFELMRGDPKKGLFQSILKLKRASQKGVDGGNAIRVQPDGTVWMYEPHRSILKADSSGRLLEEYDCPTINWATSIQPLGQAIWIGSGESGLYAYDLQSRRIVQHIRYQQLVATTLPSDHVQCLAADPTNPDILWVGTHQGLCRLDTHKMRLQNWSEEQGLPSSTINTLLTDRQGNLWFSTGKGISRLNPRTGQMRHFSTHDGLLDIEYRPNHALHLPGGRMAFGGATGTTVFDPLALIDSQQPVSTVLTDFRLANVPVDPGKNGSPLTLPLNATKTLRLNPNQNFFSIEYAGTQYNKPATLRYRYQLDGVDAHWVDAGYQTLANYTQVGPGNYQFRVNSTNADGRWSPLIKTIDIIIIPPWWRTWWFYLLVPMATLSAVYWLYRYRLAQVLKLQHLRNDIARDLHDEVGSSISTIAIYSKFVLDQLGTSTFKSEPLLVKITEQANEIMGSMNDIVWSINTQNDAFEKVFIRMREHAFQLLEAKGYILHFDLDENLYRTKIAMQKRRDFYLIYKEALNNIAKYAAGRNVWISVHLRNSTIEMLIKDDGVGFELNAGNSNGNGLSNMNYRAAIMKGSLRIVSEPGRGTTLQLSF